NAPTTAATGGTLAAATYYYRVSALFGTVESAPSNELSVPTTGRASCRTITWTAAPNYHSQAPTGYRIYRGPAPGAQNGYYTAAGTSLPFTDTGHPAPTPGFPTPLGPTQHAPTTAATGGTLAAATYYYRVSALFGTVESAPSSELSVP